MKITGSERIFKHSINKHRLRYMKLYSDGDSKSFNAVENRYEGIKS